MRRQGGLLAALALLAGCAHGSSAPPASPPGVAMDACDAAKAGILVGQAGTPELTETARKSSGARAVRTITPGAMVTMDYQPDRLNMTVDDKGVITAIRCG